MPELNHKKPSSELKTLAQLASKKWRFAISFILLFFVFEFAYNSIRDTDIEKLLIDHATVAPSAALINTIKPTEKVIATGHRLISPNVRLSVLNGCEGTETILLLVAAIIAFSASWKYKFLGILMGTTMIYLVNQGRIVGLYFCLRLDKALFDMIHGYIGPTLIIVIAALFFIWWANFSLQQSNVKTTSL